MVVSLYPRICVNPDCRPGDKPREIPYKQARRGLCPTCYTRLIKSGTLDRKRKPKVKNDTNYAIYPWDVIAELELLRELGRRDFWTFFTYVFGAETNPKGERWIEPSVHQPMAAWYEKHIKEWLSWRAENKADPTVPPRQKHLAVLVHREVGKTTMISQAGQAWLHLLDPEISTFTGSEKSQLAAKIMAGIKAIFEGADPHSAFVPLYGNWASNARTWTGVEVVHAARRNVSKKDPSLGTFGVETSITGSHPDAIFYDDPISYERLVTDTNWLDTVNSQVTGLFPVIQGDGLVVFVGTRYDDDDHFGRAFRDEGVRSVAGLETDSFEVDPTGTWDVYFLAGRDAQGKPTTPKVWPDDRLKRFERRDPLRYAAQILNNPALSEFNPLTKDQIQQCLVDEKDVPWNSLRFGICCDVAFWDGKSRERKDDTCFIVHGYPRNGSGDVYLVEAHGSPLWRLEDFANRLVALVQRYRRQGKTIIGISDEVATSGRKGTTKFALQNYFADANERMPMYYEFSRGGTKKTQRMVAAASFWVDGHVRVVRNAPGVDKVMEQMSKIGQYLVNPRLRNDWADAHSDAFQPEFYQPMKQRGTQRAPYSPGSRAFDVEGLDPRMFDDSEATEWLKDCQREPIR